MIEEPDLIIPLPVTPTMLLVVWIIALIIFGIVTWMLLHHWRYYGVKGNNRIFAKGLYFVGGILFLATSLLLIGAYGVIQ